MRCYNGCPDSQLKRLLDAESSAIAKMKQINPESHVTYHHPGFGEHGWQAHEWGKPLSGFHPDIISACNEAVSNLKTTRVKSS